MPLVIPAGAATASPALEGDVLVARDGTPLPLRTWLPPADRRPAAVLVLVHGFNEHAGVYDETGRWFAARGVAAYAYDQRGFGAGPNRGVWAGEAAMADDLAAAVAAVRARHPGVPVHVLGESMGGAVILTAITAAAPPAVDGGILSAPAVWGRASMPWYQTLALWAAAHTIPGTGLTGRGLGIQASDNVEMLKARGRDPLIITQTRVDAVWGLVNLMDRAMAAAPRADARILILYGENDQLVPPGAIAQMLQALPAAAAERRRYALYPAGWHMLLHDRQRAVVWADILAWIEDPGAPLPSRADVYAVEMGACPPGAC
jgi:alpha-beta hydrolase superfamily lysophospholipase